MEGKFYVAYGSNLNKSQMAWRCRSAVPYCTGKIKDYTLLFRGASHCAVATIEPKKGAEVPVAVWKITPSDEYALDIYEGFPRLYRKETIQVRLGSGDTLKAMVYIMNAGRPESVPGLGYYNTIAEGYKDFELDKDALLSSVEPYACRSLALAREFRSPFED